MQKHGEPQPQWLHRAVDVPLKGSLWPTNAAEFREWLDRDEQARVDSATSSQPSSAEFLLAARRCTVALLTFFENFTQNRMTLSASLAIQEWIQVLSGLIVAIRLGVILKLHERNIEFSSKIDATLDSIIEYINTTLADAERTRPPRMMFAWFRAVCQGLRRWLVRDVTKQNIAGSARSSFDTISLLNKELRRPRPEFGPDPESSERFSRWLGTLLFNQDNGQESAQTSDQDVDMGIFDSLDDVVFGDGFFMNLMWSFQPV